MLHWLAGQKLPEGSLDPDATGYVEPPETPAPVFAVRAFKHAIFGTPQTVQPKSRRHSNTEAARPRNYESRPSRPIMARPRSAGDAQGLGKENDDPLIPEPLASPTKGILMTPGTAAARRKNVTFGDDVQDNGDKRPVKSGLPDDCPGKFPSPWTKPVASEATGDEATVSKKGKSKLTEALEEARDESARKNHTKKRAVDVDDDEPPKEFGEPKSESGKYWKAQYDVYRENTQHEVRKLITKQKAAKSFAKDKDFECTELKDELRKEKKRADRLERRTADLEAQLQQLQKELHNSQQSAQRSEPANSRSQKDLRAEAEKPKPAEVPRSAVMPTQAQRTVHPQTSANPRPEAPKTSPPVQNASNEPSMQTTVEPEQSKSRPRSKLETVRSQKDDDIWAQSLNSSILLPSKAAEKPSVSARGGRVVTSGTDLTPLKSLNINTLPAARLLRRDSAQTSPPPDRASKPSFVRQDSIPSPVHREKQSDVSAPFPGLPVPSPEPAIARRESPTRRGSGERAEQPFMPPPMSSAFQPVALASPPSKQAKPEQQSLIPGTSGGNREDTSPKSRAKAVVPEPKLRPSAAWSAINAPDAGKRVPSLVDKVGNEVGIDRVEAAKARIAARGRVVS